MKKNKKNLIHITSEFSLKNYSISTFILFLINKLSKNYDNKIFVETANLKTESGLIVPFLLFKNKWLDFLYIKNKIIDSNLPNTIFHLHGLWSPLQLYSLIILTYFNLPTVVHAHGMLLQPALNQNGLIKKILKNFVLFFLKYITRNKKIIFISITHEEKYSIIKYFPFSKTTSIPNPIPFENDENNRKFFITNKKIFTFFGRIHPHKNIEFIIDLFNKSKLSKDCYLYIYGIEDDLKYLLKLKKIIQYNKNIKIFKPVFGNRKIQIMNLAWVNILLSKSEVLSFSLLESGLNGLPTIVNKSFCLPKKDSISIKVRLGEDNIISKFKEIANWPKTYRNSLFKKSTKFFQLYKKSSEKFCISQMKNIYNSLDTQKVVIPKNFYNFLITSIIYGFNFFLPSSMLVFFYLSGNAEIAAESGIFAISSISITQILSSNMRSLIISNKISSQNLEGYFIFRFLFSIIFLIILFFSIIPNLNLQYPYFVFLLSSTILFQWVFEVKLIKLELLRNTTYEVLLLICYFIIGIICIFLAFQNIMFVLNYILILFCLCIFTFSLSDFLIAIKKINLHNLKLLSIKKKIINYDYLSSLSSFSQAISGIFWRFFIYNFFEKSIAGLLFAGFTLGSFSGTLFNLILGPAYLNTNIKLSKKIKYLILFIFFIVLLLNINVIFNLENFYEGVKNYIYEIDKLFFIVTTHSLLGSFFMTYAMYQRHKMIFHLNRKINIFVLDFIYNLMISVLLLLLFWFFNMNGIVYLYLISSLIAFIFYKPLSTKFYKK